MTLILATILMAITWVIALAYYIRTLKVSTVA